jgi:N-methylhydantoinase B
VFAPNSVVTARNRDRSRFAAWGIRGGKTGASSRFMCNPDANHAEELGDADIVNLEPGDILRVQGPGGGGYGPPWDRDPARVRKDVPGGFVAPQSARDCYGVVLRDGVLDHDATERLRPNMRQQPNGHYFDLGPGRARTKPS